MKIFKGENVDEKLDNAEKIIQRLIAKPSIATSKAIIPPCIISEYIDEPLLDAVLRYMFPIKGKLLYSSMFIEQMPKDGIDIYVSIGSDDKYRSDQFFMSKKFFSLETDIEISAGDRLKVSIKAKGGLEVRGIWTSFVWTPTIKDSVVKKFLAEDLEDREDAVL